MYLYTHTYIHIYVCVYIYINVCIIITNIIICKSTKNDKKIYTSTYQADLPSK